MSLPIRARLVVLQVTLLALILAGLSSFLLIRLKADLVSGIDRSLDSRAAQIALGYSGGGEGEFQDVSDASLRGLPLGESAAQLLGRDGAVLESSSRDAVAETAMIGSAALRSAFSGGDFRMTLRLGPDREDFRLLAIPISVQGRRSVIVVATSLEDVNRSIHRLLVLLLVAGPAALLASGAAGWLLARRALQPVARMTNEAAEIGGHPGEDRIEVPATSDELARLAATLNAMLDRIQRGVDEKRRFLADASHELRTPLAVMGAELDVRLRSAGVSPDEREVLSSTREEVERMTRIVANLLTLARIDEGRLDLSRNPLELREMATGVVRKMQPLAERSGVHCVVDGDGARVLADRERLEHVVMNLVENAVKHSSSGGSVRVSVWTSEGEAGLTVTDTGPGIPPDQLPRVFDRFFRIDPARSRSDGGSGLGLAISREIVEAHSGRMWALSEMGKGSAFSLALPSAPEPGG